jgi:hypothetical protein
MSLRLTATRLSGGAVWLTPLGRLSIDRLLSAGSGLSMRRGTRSAELRAGHGIDTSATWTAWLRSAR